MNGITDYLHNVTLGITSIDDLMNFILYGRRNSYTRGISWSWNYGFPNGTKFDKSRVGLELSTYSACEFYLTYGFHCANFDVMFFDLLLSNCVVYEF